MAAKTTSEMQTVQLLLWDVRKGEQQQQVTLQRRQQQLMTDIPVDGKVPRVGQNLLSWEKPFATKTKKQNDEKWGREGGILGKWKICPRSSRPTNSRCRCCLA